MASIVPGKALLWLSIPGFLLFNSIVERFMESFAAICDELVSPDGCRVRGSTPVDGQTVDAVVDAEARGQDARRRHLSQTSVVNPIQKPLGLDFDF